MKKTSLKIVTVSKPNGPPPLPFATLRTDSELSAIQVNNSSVEGLAAIYNRHLVLSEQEKLETDTDHYIVFVHDDVMIFDSMFKAKVLDAFQSFDVFGLAGTTGSLSLPEQYPPVWHLLSDKKAGCVFHYEQNCSNMLSDYFPTIFGLPLKSPATIIDGVFIGVNRDVASKNALLFDESCPSRFHFYDLIFSLYTKARGLRLGVYPIFVSHKSHGLQVVDDEFLKGASHFKRIFLDMARTERMKKDAR